MRLRKRVFDETDVEIYREEIERLKALVRRAYIEGVDDGGGEVTAEEAWEYAESRKEL